MHSYEVVFLNNQRWVTCRSHDCKRSSLCCVQVVLSSVVHCAIETNRKEEEEEEEVCLRQGKEWIEQKLDNPNCILTLWWKRRISVVARLQCQGFCPNCFAARAHQLRKRNPKSPRNEVLESRRNRRKKKCWMNRRYSPKMMIC